MTLETILTTMTKRSFIWMMCLSTKNSHDRKFKLSLMNCYSLEYGKISLVSLRSAKYSAYLYIFTFTLNVWEKSFVMKKMNNGDTKAIKITLHNGYIIVILPINLVYCNLFTIMFQFPVINRKCFMEENILLGKYETVIFFT